MYVPAFNAMPQSEVDSFLAAQAAAQLITVGPDGRPDATLVPIVTTRRSDPDAPGDGPAGLRVLAHLARQNDHWQRITDGAPVLLVVAGPDAYISPGWYATKREHGRVVPTWNYTAVHLSGTVTVHDDPDWVLDVVTRLTHRHEAHRAAPWAVTDAPAKYIRGRLRAIVGIEVLVDTVEGKAKLGQNRSDADREGAVEGLLAEPGDDAHAVGLAMRDHRRG
ncbi:transcriptional regulator [Intrasporangium oryzae NRRL B-24470]|uniref:Transcriptional regulator n=1 Tax=Intrasporangium oryzae NRRL B-24470 TaxID=1386089 RepID=W9G441_9MICO|nr:FMN-binding negative transcriptional regulator [Intrasporangium oryzae]EWT00790.1 transcriptional regulator [Intrasporangium oryzae NRRL B-24470]